MEWGKISTLMESEMSNCLLIWLIDRVTVVSDCLYESKGNNLLDWVNVCLTACLCEEWMAVCLTVWLFGCLRECFFVCLHVYMFLRFFVILLVFSSVSVHLLLFICVFDSMFVGLFDCFDTVLGCCLDRLNIDWVNDCLFDCSREWLRLFNWGNTCMLECFSDALAEGASVCLTVSSDCLFD